MPVDYSKYPKNWLSEIRPRILERAGHCCEKCGIENKTIVYSIKSFETGKKIWFRYMGYALRYRTSSHDDLHEDLSFSDIKEVRVVLTIAHLDHDETNLNVTDKRLMAMCQKCHLQYDAEEKKRRKLNKQKKEKS
jgi:hypothetical protein